MSLPVFYVDVLQRRAELPSAAGIAAGGPAESDIAQLFKLLPKSAGERRGRERVYSFQVRFLI